MNQLHPRYLAYRLSTIWNSLKALYKISPKQVDAFIKSYEIYHCDWVDGQAMVDSKVIEYSVVKEKLLDWYSTINHLCALGQVEKMYIPPALDLSKNVVENQNLFEKSFCKQLDMKPGHRSLDLGCGKGRVAAHLAMISGAKVIGINIDHGQLDNAVCYAKKKRLSEQLQYMNADFNDLPLPFEDNYFDSVYELQAISLSRDLEKLCCELHRVLKPGGKLSFLEWVRLPNYDPQNPHHVKLMQRIKPLVGAISTPSPEEMEEALRKAGFQILLSEDPSINKTQEPVLNAARHSFNRRLRLIQFLAAMKLIPKHFVLLFERFTQDGKALREAEELGLVTTSYHVVAEKTKG